MQKVTTNINVTVTAHIKEASLQNNGRLCFDATRQEWMQHLNANDTAEQYHPVKNFHVTLPFLHYGLRMNKTAVYDNGI